ncbi:hypothetical protein S7335_27 [Synechococcus sp. PCC 7335]|nr:hypothetical protein S7335_27 [Synechococcus sp. PCC 7335]
MPSEIAEVLQHPLWKSCYIERTPARHCARMLSASRAL